MKRIFTFILLVSIGLATQLQAQTTISTTTSGTNYTGGNGVGGNSAITFVVDNTSGADILLTEVGDYFQTASNGATVTLWYSSTSLSGAPTIATPDWTSIATGTVTVPADGVVPTFTNLNFTIPSGAQYRFAIQSSANIRYSGATPVPTPSIFTSNGVSLEVGDYQINSANVGYGGAFPGPLNNPRWFTGYITFMPASACTAPPIAGLIQSNNSPACAGSQFTLSITPGSGTGGMGQTYQWQSSPDTLSWTTNPADTFSVLTTTQTASTWYHLIVTCSGMSDTSDAFQQVTPPLIPAGTFTINSTLGTGGTNFATFGEAINFLKCGIAGPIVFNVAPGSGPYNEQVTIPAIYGTSATNTITFKGNGETLKFASADGNNRHVIKLDGADFITIDSLTIDATGGTYGWGIHFMNGADNDSIKSCMINCDVAATSTNYAGIVMSGSVTSATTGGNAANNAVIIGNTVTGGYYGIINYGMTVAPFPTGNQYINNVVNDFYYYGIYTYGAINPVIMGNTVERLTRTNQTTTYGIYMGTYTSGVVCDKNRVWHLYDMNPASTSACYGIYISGDALAGTQNLVTNNLVSDINHNGTIYGIENAGGAGMKAYHNTISLDNTTATAGTTDGFYQTTSDTGIVFMNNLITITRGGSGSKYGIYMATSTTPLVSNYNDVFISSTGSGTQAFGYNLSDRVTLADWQTATGQDMNSVTMDPVYAAPGSDYTPTAAALDDRGTPVGVTTDIIGTPRNLSHPDIGAYEFSGGACSTPPTAGDATAPIDTVCVGSSVALQLMNNSVGTGQTYQWETSSSSTGPWTPVGPPSGISDTSVTMTTSAWFHAVVTCGTSTAFSTPIYITVSQPLAGGTYTINSAAATGGSNFTSFTDAAYALKCGVAGPVVFNVVAGSGPYTEQFSLPALAGTSPVNTVTFNGNGETIKFASADANARHVIQLNGADYVTFRDLTVDATGGTYGYGIQIMNQSNNDSIVNCTVLTEATSTSTNFAGIVITGAPNSATTSGNNASNTVVMNCTITGGYYGITNYGTAAAPFTSNNQFINNTITDFYYYGFYSYGSVNTVASGNTIQRPGRATPGTGYGMYFSTYTSGALIEKNRVRHLFDGGTTSTSTGYGIYISGDATAATPNRIQNNLISEINNEGTVYGIYDAGSMHSKVYHNTVSLDYAASTGTSTYNTYGIYVTADTGIEVLNNIITITRGGGSTKYGIYISSGSPTVVSNYNDIYVNSAGTGTQYTGYQTTGYATLAAWMATGHDSSSVAIDPLYASPSTEDYHPTEATLNDLGTPVGVSTDIENTVRNSTHPDMGAYEFSIGNCVSPPTPGSAIANDTSICANSAVILNVVGNSVGQGQTYQWQLDNGSGFNNIGNVLTYADTTIYPTLSGSYRVAVTCGTSTTYSTPVNLTVNPPVAGGSYTINSAAPTGGGNFNSFADAINFMTCGISGPVVFDVLPGTGGTTYNEQVIIPAIAGTSATNTITFNGNGNIISFTSTSSTERATLKLNGANHVTVRDLVIDALGNTTSQYGFGIQLLNNADSNRIINCTVNVDTSTTSTNFAGIVISGDPASATGTGSMCDGNVIDSNTVNGGYYGITLAGTATVGSFITGNSVTHNTVNDAYLYSVYVTGTDSTLIERNQMQRMSRVSTLGAFYGVYFTGLSEHAQVSKNRMHDPYGANNASTSSAYGIYFTGVDARAGNENIVSNNAIYNFIGGGTQYGIYNTSSDGAWYYHNTINLDDTLYTGTGITRGFYQTTLAADIQFKNNLITIRRTGSGQKYAMYFATSTSTIASDYNDLFITTPGSNGNSTGYAGAAQATLTDWQLASGQDAHSIAEDPLYVNAPAGDLHPTSALVDDKGTPVGIFTDIIETPRSTSTPDVGAFEFGNIVPVRLVDFTAVKAHTDALLSWTTNGEINFSRFEVQRSANGASFENAGIVNAGTPSAGLKSYRFTDAGVLVQPTTLYYRLKMIDRDGRFEYSKVVSVKGQGSETVAVYPNPVIKELFVKVSVEKTQRVIVKLSDLSGRVLGTSTQTIAAGTTVINIPAAEKLVTGIYVVTVELESGSHNYKVVK